MADLGSSQKEIIDGTSFRAQELRESLGGCPGLLVPNSPYSLCGCKAALNLNNNPSAQGLRESQGGCPGLLVPNSPYGLCGCKAAMKEGLVGEQSLLPHLLPSPWLPFLFLHQSWFQHLFLLCTDRKWLSVSFQSHSITSDKAIA